MKTKFLETSFSYNGEQLRPLTNYLQYRLLGDSCVAWVGGCDIPAAHMVDGEDLLAQSVIKGSKMLHFVFEVFDRELVSGVFLQRLFASMVQDEIFRQSGKTLRRSGDDLFLEDRKLSISIATRSSNSVLVHFALNVSNQGTPVKTCSLEDFSINPKAFAETLMQKVSTEYQDILDSAKKVRTF